MDLDFFALTMMINDQIRDLDVVVTDKRTSNVVAFSSTRSWSRRASARSSAHCARVKHQEHTHFRNIFDATIAAIFWWWFGYVLSFGSDDGTAFYVFGRLERRPGAS